MKHDLQKTLTSRITRLGLGLKTTLLASSFVIINSCTTLPPVEAPMAPAFSDAERSSIKAAPKAVAKKSFGSTTVTNRRPGIATGWGKEIESNVNFTDFKRSKKHSSVSSIYYNDKEGIKAMTSEWRYTGKGMQKSADGLVEWGVKGRWGNLKNIHSQGKRFVVGSKGSNYALVVKNIAHTKLELVMSVDGLDILTGKPASIKNRGYIIEPGKTLTIKGFRKSAEAVAAFKFSSVRDSYSNLSQQGTRNVGVMGMAIFTQSGRDPWKYGATERNNRRSANPFAEAPQLRAR